MITNTDSMVAGNCPWTAR